MRGDEEEEELGEGRKEKNYRNKNKGNDGGRN